MQQLRRITRRESIKWVVAASATASLLSTRGFGANAAVRGYGQDPKLLETYKPGDLWPLTFTKEQRRAAVVLCDVIIPADHSRATLLFCECERPQIARLIDPKSTRLNSSHQIISY